MWRKITLRILCLAFSCSTQNSFAGAIPQCDWVRQPNSPYVAETATELLAVKVITSNLADKGVGSLKARYLGEDSYFSVVEVAEVPIEPGAAYKIELFRMIGRQIASSCQIYRQDENTSPSRQRLASEVARNYHNGTLPNIPLIYDGKYTYRPKRVNRCEIMVDELGLDREVLTTYSIDICTAESS